MKKIAEFFKKKRTYFKAISMILVLALMIQTVSIAVTAVEELDLSIDEMVSIDEEFPVDNSLETMPSIVGEVESKRDQHIKVYELADGSFYEVISNEPLHKNIDGQWEEPTNNMDMPESVEEVASYCNELVESISEEQNDSGVSTFSLIVDEENSHPLIDTYVIGSSGAVVTTDQVNKTNRLFVRIPDSLVSYSNTNQITLNQSLNVEFTVNKTGGTGLMYAYGILEDWEINDAQQLTAYRLNEESEIYSYSSVGPNSIKRQENVTDNFAFIKSDTIGCLDITELCVKWSKKLLDNNGIIIIPDDASRATIGNCYLTRRYLIVDAYDTDFTYHSIDMGKAGQVLVNDFTNTITIQRNEMYYPTGKMPINLYRYFDFSKTYVDANPAGVGSHWNYESPIKAEASERIAWSAFDGRTIRFKPSAEGSNEWHDENGEGYTLNISATNITGENYDGVTIISPDGLTYTFGTAGKIKRIDNISNFIKVNYHDEATQDYITSIENNSGYRYYFEYSNDYNLDGEPDSDKFALNYIYYQKKTDDNQYSTISIDGVDVVMTYTYTLLPDGNIALSEVTYPYDSETPEVDRLTVEYLYDNGRLVGIIDIDKRKLEINYTGKVPDYTNNSDTKIDVDNYPSVFSLKEYVFNKAYIDGMPEEEKYLQNSLLDIERHLTYQRTFTDMQNNTETIHYNQELNLLYYTNDNGDSYYVEYATSDDGQYVSQILSPEKIENNLINGDFEKDESVFENEWYTDAYSSLEIIGGNLDGNGTEYGTIEGSIGFERYANKFAKIDGTAGDIIAVGCHARATSAVPTDAHFFGVEIYGAVDWGDNDLESTEELLYRLAFDPTMDNEVQYRMGAFKLTDSFEYIEFRFVYSYQNGLAEFDNALAYNASEDNVTFFDPPAPDNNTSDESSSSSNENDNFNTNDVLSDGVNQMGTLYDYSAETNYLTELTDSNDVTTNFSYNQFTGFLSEKHVDMGDDSTDIIDKYSYNALGALTEVSRVVGYTKNANNEDTEIYNTTRYEYEYGKISSVVHNNMTYQFNYNSYGELEGIVVSTAGNDDIPLISHGSTTNENVTLNTITYSNGYVLEYTYDDGKITSISERSTPSSDLNLLYSYEYDDVSGDLETIKDYVSCRIIKYSVDSFEVHELVKNDGNESEGDLLYSKSIDNGAEVYNVFSVGYTKTPNNSTYNNESKITTYSSSTTTNIGNPVKFDSYSAYDYFGRIKNSSVIVSEQDVQNNEDYTIKHSIENESTYLNNADGTLTTNLLGSYSSTIRSGPVGSGTVLNEFTSEYSYDKAGRITHIYYKQNDNNRDLKYYYEYDVAGQLVKEADFIKMTYTEYTYNNFGNVTEKKIYSGTNCFKYENDTIVVTSDEPFKTIEFEYDENYSDVLAKYKVNGVPKYITPDLYGNPNKYHRIDGNTVQTYHLEWEGNQLHTVRPADDDSLYEYKYDDEGRRTQKILYSDYNPIEPETKTVDMIMDYVWDNNKLMGYRIDFPSDTSVIIDAAILYDELDEPIGLRFCINGLTNGENDPDLSNEDIFWFIKDGQGNVVAIYSEKSNYTIGCNYTPDGKLEISNSNDFSEELNQKIEAANDFRKGLLIALSAILAIRASTMLSTDASQATYISAIMDEETGLYYCQNRYYSPEYGRYINVGNVEEIASDIYNPFDANPFVYYNNDPVNCKGTASSKKPATKVVGIQAELSKSLTSFTDSTGIELIYDSVKDELYAYYYQDANSYSNYNGMPRAIEMITDIFENVSFSSNVSLKNLALVFKMNNYVSLSYFNAETNKRFIWPTSYLGVAKVEPDDNNRYTVYGSGYQSKGICYYPVSNLGFGTKDMSVRYQKIEWESEEFNDYLLANKDNIIEAVK